MPRVAATRSAPIAGNGAILAVATALAVLANAAVSSTALAAGSPTSPAIGASALFLFSMPPFVFGLGAYALSRRFGASIAAATALGVPAMFIIAHLTTGTSGMARGILGIATLSALFSCLGATCARLLARDAERGGGKRTATAVAAGLLLGAAVFAGLASIILVPPGKNVEIATIFCSLLAVVGAGACMIAMKTDSVAGTASGITLAMAVPILFFDTTGYIVAIYIMTFLPVTIAAAGLGGAFARRRSRQAKKVRAVLDFDQ